MSWAKNFVISGASEHTMLEAIGAPGEKRLTLELSGAAIEFSSPMPKSGQRILVTVEVEEDAPRFETGADVGFTLRIEGP